MKVIALIDFDDGGHNRWHFEENARALLQLGYTVIAIAPFASIVFRGKNNINEDSLIIRDFRPWSKVEAYSKKIATKGLYRAASLSYALRFERLKAKLKKCEQETTFKVDHCYFNTLWALQVQAAINWRKQSRWPWSGLYLHIHHFRGHGKINYGKKRLGDLKTAFNSKSLRALTVLDEGALHWLKQRVSCPVLARPELVHLKWSKQTEAFARKIRGLAKGRPVVSISGHLIETKGLADFIDLSRRKTNKDLFFLAVGQIGTDEKEEVGFLKKAADGRLANAFAILDRIDDESEFNGIFLASDLVWAAYRRFPHSSGIQGKAAAFGKPCMVSDGYLLAERNRQYNLGPIVKEGDLTDMHRVLRQLTIPHERQLLCANHKGQQFIEDHSFDRLVEMYANLLR